MKFTPVDHPDASVRRIGFGLTDPYVEQCRPTVIAPSSTVLLRLPTLWSAGVPAEVAAGQRPRSARCGAGAGERSRLGSTFERLVTFGVVRPAPDPRRKGTGLDVYRPVPPSTQRQLAWLPERTQDAEERFLGAHLTQVDAASRHWANVVSITARLDRLQHLADHRLGCPTYLGPGIA